MALADRADDERERPAHRLLDDDPRDARVEEVPDAARRVLVDDQHDVRVGEAAADAVDLGRRAAEGDAGEDDDVGQPGEALDDQAAVAAELDVRRHPVAPQRGTDAVDQARVVGHDRDRDDRGARTAPAGERDHAGHVADAARSAHATAFGVNVAGADSAFARLACIATRPRWYSAWTEPSLRSIRSAISRGRRPMNCRSTITSR